VGSNGASLSVPLMLLDGYVASRILEHADSYIGESKAGG
jgi:hypothetical protein